MCDVQNGRSEARIVNFQGAPGRSSCAGQVPGVQQAAFLEPSHHAWQIHAEPGQWPYPCLLDFLFLPYAYVFG